MFCYQELQFDLSQFAAFQDGVWSQQWGHVWRKTTSQQLARVLARRGDVRDGGRNFCHQRVIQSGLLVCFFVSAASNQHYQVLCEHQQQKQAQGARQPDGLEMQQHPTA